MVAAVLVAALALAGGAAASPLRARQNTTVPSYVTQYAPMVWLYSQEYYFPAAWSSQLQNTHPEVNFANVTGAPSPLTLNNLSQLNSLGGTNVSLSSNDDFTKYPEWLNGTKPDSTGKVAGDPSCAIIVADKGNNTVDAFYIYFYNFNLGNIVFGTPAGNHVGDIEHNMVRFVNGEPQAMWFSQHDFGEAFTYSCVEKYNNGVRPVSYSATGTHANYAITGKHDHTIPGVNLPFNLFLTDLTDQGTLWDPAANAYFYSYDVSSSQFTAYDGTSPTDYLNFQGIWGDEELPSSDPRQHYDLGIKLTAEWTGGPTGPRDKDLERVDVCPSGHTCTVKTSLGP